MYKLYATTSPLPSNKVFLLTLEKAFMGLSLHSFMKGYSRLLLSLKTSVKSLFIPEEVPKKKLIYVLPLKNYSTFDSTLTALFKFCKSAYILNEFCAAINQ